MLWLASVLVTATAANFNMTPTVVLLGSFLAGFFVGGVIAILGEAREEQRSRSAA